MELKPLRKIAGPNNYFLYLQLVETTSLLRDPVKCTDMKSRRIETWNREECGEGYYDITFVNSLQIVFQTRILPSALILGIRQIFVLGPHKSRDQVSARSGFGEASRFL